MSDVKPHETTTGALKDSKVDVSSVTPTILAGANATTTTTSTSSATTAGGSSTPSGTDTATAGGNTTNPPAWMKRYEAFVQSAAVPNAISSRMPTSGTVAQSLDQTQAKLQEITTTSKASLDKTWSVGKTRYSEWKLATDKKMNKEQFFKNAWSVTNETQVVLNVSLNQVGPLMYQVLLPGETFERRVPNVWYALSIRPWTSPETEYTSWSVAWPIIAIAGPVSAAASLIAIPFVALAAGGTALASLTGFGSSVATGVTSAGTAVTSTAASVAGLAARAASLPGGSKVRGKLVDAAKGAFGARGEVIIPKVVKYLTTSAAAGGALKGPEAEHWKVEEAKSKKKVSEVDVTGLDLQKVLRCDTGKSKVDKQLTQAFEHLHFKKHYKTSTNPVLRITGGPELEERGDKQVLVFYHFVLEQAIDIAVEPVPVEEVPPTQSEEALVKDARVVPTLEEAEQVSKDVPVHGTGEHPEKVDEVVEKVMSEHGDKVERTKSEEEKTEEKKGWFSWRK
ncbi:BQ2448_5958 [Microbotryum intermedium]|uniref:BQ2448_5958 protein n=1 Tax=Microbotryum intermedium TaxID=269621 RepID=A0A238EZM2_9BASI|nr:BQ2448_5958 [Microbotryum intermedium]